MASLSIREQLYVVMSRLALDLDKFGVFLLLEEDGMFMRKNSWNQSRDSGHEFKLRLLIVYWEMKVLACININP